MSSCISVINNCLPDRELSHDEYKEFFDFADKVEAWKDQFKELSQGGTYTLFYDDDYIWEVHSAKRFWRGITPQEAVHRAYNDVFND